MPRIAPAGGMSLMDELAKKFKSRENTEKAIGDDDDTPTVASSKPVSVSVDDEEEKIDTKTKKPQAAAPSSLASLPVDEKGAISVRQFALGDDKPELLKPVKPTPPPPPPPRKPKEETKEEVEDEDDVVEFLKAKKAEENKHVPDENDKEDEENIQRARKATVRKVKQNEIKREETIQDADEFLKSDQATYVSSVWVEIINAEGDKVYLNRITGEVALKKPDEDSDPSKASSPTLLGMVPTASGEEEEDWRWLPDQEEAWIPAQFIKKKPNGKYEYQDVEGIMFTISEKMHKSSIKFQKKSLQNYVHDLLMLDEINEANILYNIKNRFSKKRIYTRLGKILISVNPYKLYPLYTPDVIERYQSSRVVNQLPPHVYEVAKAAIEELVKTKHPQSILIAGESGSGKTEACKQCMQYLAEVAGSESDMEKKLLDCNPILESLGNAQTIRNDNSSRFGKWSEIYFDENGKIVSGKITDYLMEKSRVSHQENGERNYHIFYQICRGLSKQEKEQFYLMDVDDYKYLTQSNKTTIKNVDDAAVFKETAEAMDTIL